MAGANDLEPAAHADAGTPSAAAPAQRDNQRAPAGHQDTSSGHRNPNDRPPPPLYAALDLGTNNCRLLVAKPARQGFRVVDAFSRIIRLGEGVSHSGRLSDAAIERTIEALKVCAGKMANRRIARSRAIATEACRLADNGEAFIARVAEETGLALEIVSRETEARLAVSGCASLLDPDSEGALVFDIGGGSSEIALLDLKPGRRCCPLDAQRRIKAWTSLPVGVVTLAERFGGVTVTRETFETMVKHVQELLQDFETRWGVSESLCRRNTHMLGTSGTVTTIAGIHLRLARYDRSKVDGCWLTKEQAADVTDRLVAMSYEERVANPCIGAERADLVLAGCAILEAIQRQWPCKRLRVADRGLREGLLATMMAEDGTLNVGGRRRNHLSRRWRGNQA